MNVYIQRALQQQPALRCSQEQQLIQRRISGDIEQTLGILLSCLAGMETATRRILLACEVERWSETDLWRGRKRRQVGWKRCVWALKWRSSGASVLPVRCGRAVRVAGDQRAA